MSAWPTDLPNPMADGYQFTPGNAVIRTDMESGPARQRQRFTTVPVSVSVSWRFTVAQMVTFRDFFENTIHRGADWFTVSLDAGAGLASYDARFAEVYQAAWMPGGGWEVTSKLEVRNA